MYFSGSKIKLKRQHIVVLFVFMFLSMMGGIGAVLAGPFAQPEPPIESDIVEVQGFFELLFGRPSTRRNRTRPPADIGRSGVRSRRRAPSVSSGNIGLASAPPVPADKVENARRIVVIGDAMAIGLAKGLETLFAASPDIVVSNRATGSSGIVRYDFFDWAVALPTILAEENPAAFVIMIGSNDRQDILGTEAAEFRTQKWLGVYEARVQHLLDTVAARNIPIFWVGMPIMRRAAYGQDISFLNDLFQQQSNRVGATFIESWNRFADVEGRYNSSGPDVNGRVRRMRNDNGIHLTTQGNLKLAYFVEQELRPRLGGRGGAPNIEIAGVPTLPPDERPRDMLGVEMSLTSPTLGDGIAILSGGRSENNTRNDTGGGSRLAGLGTSPTPLAGRADDFSWPPPENVAGTENTPPL